jgi:hypothetical protein
MGRCERLRSGVIKKVRSGPGAARVIASTTTNGAGKYSVRHTNGGAGSYYAVAQVKTVSDGIDQTRCTKAQSTTKSFAR